MFVFFFLSVLALFVNAAPISTSQWFTVEWNAPEFTAISGTFTIPSLTAESGAVFVWPGLQGDAGALQAEVSGSAEGLRLRNVFYGAETSTGKPSSSRLEVTPGQQVRFKIFKHPVSGNWIATLDDRPLWSSFTLGGAVMNRAIFAIEATNGIHNFDVKFSDVNITATSESAASWCKTAAFNGFGAQALTIEGATASSKTCTISSVVLPATIPTA